MDGENNFKPMLVVRAVTTTGALPPGPRAQGTPEGPQIERLFLEHVSFMKSNSWITIQVLFLWESGEEVLAELPGDFDITIGGDIILQPFSVVLDGEDSEEEKHRRSESDLFKKRSTEGAYQILICRHQYSNENKFREYFRLTPALFDCVLGYIIEDLCSKPTNRVQNPLTPEQKLCLLLRYFRICHSWISTIIRQVSESIVSRMLTLVMPQPTEEIFKSISRKFRSLGDFPISIGAIDGKHVRIKAPKNSGSTFFNYKEFYSVVLALVDADNKFVAVDIGSYGRE
nr:unnamed protein product [Callosobruchus analis]